MFSAPNSVQTVQNSAKLRLTVCKLVGPHLKRSNKNLKHALFAKNKTANSNGKYT